MNFAVCTVVYDAPETARFACNVPEYFLHVGVWERLAESQLFVLHEVKHPLACRIRHLGVLYKVKLRN